MIFFFSNTAHPLFFSNEALCEISQYIKQIDAYGNEYEKRIAHFFIFPCCSRDILTEPCLSFQSPYFPKHPNLQSYWTVWRLLHHALSHFFAAAAQCSFICLESALSSSPQLKYDLPAHLPLCHFFSLCASSITLTTLNCKFLLIYFFPSKLWPSRNQRT